MLKFLVSVILFLGVTYDCRAQWEWKTRFNGEILVLTGNYRSNDAIILYLSRKSRVDLTLALKKGLKWAQINQTKKLEFGKIISEIHTKTAHYSNPNPYDVKTKKFSSGKTINYNYLDVVFIGKSDNDYEINLFGSMSRYSGKPIGFEDGESTLLIRPRYANDSAEPFLISFYSSKEINSFISILQTYQPRAENLNNIFE